MTPSSIQLFTVGHSNHSMAGFLELLQRHEVAAVADVRARPYSRYVPHFSKERLCRQLEAGGIGYLYLGRELGGTPTSQQASGTPWVAYAARIERPRSRAASRGSWRRRARNARRCCAGNAILWTATDSI